MNRSMIQKPACDLIEDLGYDPSLVLDRSGGMADIERDGDSVVLEVIERGADGKVIRDDMDLGPKVTEVRVTVTPERWAAYVEAAATRFAPSEATTP